jgi:hypothetical protein
MLVTAVKQSFDYCAGGIWADYYSTTASYLRLNGILPPTAQAQKP